MGFDPFSAKSLATINVLCVPAKPCDPKQFGTWIQILSKHASVLPRPIAKADQLNGESVSGVGKDGALLFQFSGQYGDEVLSKSYFFEPSRHPCLVLGLLDDTSSIDSKHDHDLNDDLLPLLDTMRDVSSSHATDGALFKLVLFGEIPMTSSKDVLRIDPFTDQLPDAACRWFIESASTALNHSLERVRLQDVELPQWKNNPNLEGLVEARRDQRTDDVRRQSLLQSLTRSPTQTPSIPDSEAQNVQSGKTVAAALIKLQLGLWQEALRQFADGARAARESNSPAWHGKALEGILTCLLLLAWEGQDFKIPQDCYPSHQGTWNSSAIHNVAEANRGMSEKHAVGSAHPLQSLTALLAGLGATIINLYDRAVLGYDDGLPSILVCEARIRLVRLLLSIRKHDGIVRIEALSDMLSLPRNSPIAASAESTNISLVLRPSHLGNVLIEAIKEAQASLSIYGAATIYFAACQSLSDLKLERKQGFYIKDVLQRLPPVLTEARRRGTAQIERSSAEVDPRTTELNCQDSIASAVRALLHLAARIFGLPQLNYAATSANPEEKLEALRRRLESWLTVFTSGDIATKLEVLRLCVRISDALPDLIGSVNFMSLVLFISRQTITFTRGIVNAVPLIAAEEQTRLLSGINNTIDFARRSQVRGEILAHYWDDFLVRGIEVYEDPSAGKLIPHSSQDLFDTTKSGTAKRDPFIYNPFSKGETSDRPRILIKDDIASFEVLLQNPLEIDVEIERLTLIAEGCNFEPHPMAGIIGPMTTQTFRVTGIPRGVGSLTLSGCKVKVKHCVEQEFAIFQGAWKPAHTIKQKQTQSVQITLPNSSVLELKVIEPLPQLRISTIGLVQKSIMLLDGEKTSFTLTLQNINGIAADFVLFGFQDTVSKQLQEVLDTKDLLPAESYELQHQLTTEPSIQRIHRGKSNGSGLVIGAKQSQSFDFQVLGKPGLIEVIIVIDYTYLGKPRNEVEGTFHTRQIRMPISVTVNGSVDIPRCSILTMPGAGHGTTEDTETYALRHQCLLQLDLRSFWQMPVEVAIRVRTSDVEESSSASALEESYSSVLQPGQIERTLVLVPRIYIAEPFAPIPGLDTKRQFVVSASKLSLEADLAAREAFWYREALCKRLKIAWKEVYGGRHGDVDVRKGVRLSPRMIDALRVEHVYLSFSVGAPGEDSADVVLERSKSSYEVRKDASLNLTVRIHNLSQQACRFMLRLHPSLQDQPHHMAIDLGKKFLWSGALQRAIKQPVEPGKAVDVETGITLLAEGSYEINATVEELTSRRNRAETSSANLREERRIWHAQTPCLLTVSAA